MSLRQKYTFITLVSFLIGVADIFLMSAVHLRGYALLPFVIVAGLSLYIAFASFVCIIAPPKSPTKLAEQTIWYLLLEAVFGHFFK